MQKLLDAISDRFSSDAHEFTRVVAEACLVDGLRSCSRGFQLLPVSCCKIGAAVKRKCPDLPGKLITNLQQQKCQRYFMLIPGPPGTQPAVLLVLTAILSKPYSKAVAKVMNKMYSSSEHPSSGKQPFSGSDSASEGSQDSNASDLMDMLQVHQLLCVNVFCNLLYHAGYLSCAWSNVCMASAQASSLACLHTSVDSSCSTVSAIFPAGLYRCHST